MRTSLDDYFDGFFDAIEQGESKAEYSRAIKMIAEFGVYVDMLASANPHRLHHVYEWGQVGTESGRLFDLTAVPSGTGVVITYNFKQSTVPNENGVVFANKASVMESGETVSFETNRPVPIGDGKFRVGRFTFVPGGMDTNGAFMETFMLYFSTRAQEFSDASYTMPRSNSTRAAGTRDGKIIYDRINS